MNSSNINRDYEQEVDLIDLLCEWLSHWRSILVFVAAGVVLGGLWAGISALRTPAAEPAAEPEVVEDLIEPVAPVEPDSRYYVVNEFVYGDYREESEELSESEMHSVDNLVALYNDYTALQAEYDEKAKTLSAADRAAVLDNLTRSWSTIESIGRGMRDACRDEFYKKIGVKFKTREALALKEADRVAAREAYERAKADALRNWELTKLETERAAKQAQKDYEAAKEQYEKDLKAYEESKKPRAEVVTVHAETPSISLTDVLKKVVICAFVALFLHACIVAMFYVFNTKLKYSDKLMRILSCAELAKCVDWETIDRKKSIDRLIARARLAHVRRVDLSESIQINADSINSIAANSDITSIAIVTGGLIAEAEDLKKALLRVNEKLEIKCVTSLIFDAVGAKTVSSCQGAVILADVRKSDIRELREESFALANREINLIGAITYVL